MGGKKESQLERDGKTKLQKVVIGCLKTKLERRHFCEKSRQNIFFPLL